VQAKDFLLKNYYLLTANCQLPPIFAPMSHGRVILTQGRFALTLDRLCYQLIENYDDFDQTCLVGIQPRGVALAERINRRLLDITGVSHIEYGKLDITFYRDDFRHRDKPLRASVTEMDFLVENKNVVLIDDVLYTGRTVQAALTALQHYGRPRRVELLALVDRRFNREIPIEADYTGIRVDALDEAYVKVEWQEVEGEDQVLLFPQKV
jgi:pyrimidine operon attenuation protein/uracil phosphoribosyltransferase